MSATIDDILQSVASDPGTSAGIAPAQLRAIWNGLCQHLRAMLERRRSIVVPDFLHFVVQKHDRHSGTWGARVTWVPVVTPVPSFSQAYGIPITQQTSVLHQGATSPSPINATAIMAHCGSQVSRHGVSNAVKDIVRQIGAHVSCASGRPLVLNMQFVTLTFHSRRLSSVSWNHSFTSSLNSDTQVSEALRDGLSPRTAAARRELESRGRSATPRGGSTTPRRGSTPRGASGTPRGVAAAAAAGGGGFGAAPAPQERSTPIPALAEDQPAKPVPQPPAPPVAGASTQQPHLHDGVSPRRVAQEAVMRHTLDAVRASDASPHRKRQARKLAYRRGRNQAYEDAWEKSLEERRRQAADELARDKLMAAAVLAKQAEDKQRMEAEARERRQEGRRVLDVNLELATIRRGRGVPRVQGPGDIFDARRPVQKVPADMPTLTKQIEERRAREEREKAEAAAYGEAAWQEAASQKAEEQRQKIEQHEARQAASREYDRLIAEKRARAKSERDAELELERKCSGFQGGFGEQGSYFAAQSVAIQKANYEMVLQRAVDRKQREADEKERLADTVRRIEARDSALRDQQRRSKSARQAQMRTAWSSQMSERVMKRREETDERRNWRDVNFLQNESSDDEDVDPGRFTKIPNRRPGTGGSLVPRPPSSSPRAVIH